MNCVRTPGKWETGYIVDTTHGTNKSIKSRFIITRLNLEAGIADLLELKRQNPVEILRVSLDDLTFVNGLYPVKPGTSTMAERTDVVFLLDEKGRTIMPEEYARPLTLFKLWLD